MSWGIGGFLVLGLLVAGLPSCQADLPWEPGDLATLTYGQSVTDACLGWDDSAQVLQVLAEAVKKRRK